MGLTRYKGTITPIETASDRETGTTTYTFDPEEGPQCMRGDPFLTGIRTTDSEDLVIFLQGEEPAGPFSALPLPEPSRGFRPWIF